MQCATRRPAAGRSSTPPGCARCIPSRCSTARPGSAEGAVVGLVIVSHSAALAGGVVELAREMGGGEVQIEAAGGMEDGALGTDAARVFEAVERVRSSDGALAMKSAQLGGAEPDSAVAPAPGDGDELQELRLRVDARLGLHARPAARFVGALGGIDARVLVTNETRGRGPADGRSLTGLATLAVRQGDEIVVSASGAGADDALAALRALAAENFGDPREDGEAQGAAPSEAAAAGLAPAAAPASGAPGAPPAPGSRLRGIPASAGIAIGPARRLRPQQPPVEEEPGGPPAEERARLEAGTPGGFRRRRGGG